MLKLKNYVFFLFLMVLLVKRPFPFFFENLSKMSISGLIKNFGAISETPSM